MNDRELLEMAAKAVKLTGYIHEWINGPEFIVPGENPVTWNPLTDDGDALRLASRLCMLVSTGPIEAKASTIDGALRGFFPKEETIIQGQGEAVRRVIVRAAAEIGKAMP